MPKLNRPQSQQQVSNESIRNRYNPEYFHNKALSHLDSVSKEEASNWHQHHCTQALLNALEGDLSGIVIGMIGGAYFDEESAAGTAQKHSKALGMSSAINDVIEYIKEIKNLSLDGESSDERSAYQTGGLPDFS